MGYDKQMQFGSDFSGRTPEQKEAFSDRSYQELELGELYQVGWGWPRGNPVKFIRTSPKGFNFLNLETNKCILKPPLFKATKGRNQGKFSINKKFKIRKI